MTPKLTALLKAAAEHKMTKWEIDEQRRSWVRGNLLLDNPDMTVDEANSLIEKVFEFVTGASVPGKDRIAVDVKAAK